MTVLRSNSSKALCTSHIKKYLDGKDAERIRAERVLGFDMEGLICCWDQVMDDTRNPRFGGLGDVHNGKKVTTYRHFVISPDPECGISKHNLLELATEWARAHFGDVGVRGSLGRFEAYICIHDDNDGNVPHAHVIVNNSDLDTHRRLRMTPKEFSGLWDSIQDVSRDWGIPALPEHGTWIKAEASRRKRGAAAVENEVHWKASPEAERALAAKRKELWRAKAIYRALERKGLHDIERARQAKTDAKRLAKEIDSMSSKYARKSRGRRLSSVERKLMRSGRFSWKQDLANAVKLSVDTSRDEGEFLESMAALGCACEVADGDYLIRHPKNPAQWKVSGWKLGNNYRRTEVLKQIDPRHKVPSYVKDQALADVLALMADETYTEAYIDKAVRLADASKAIRFLREHGIRTQDGFATVAKRIEEKEGRGESAQKISRLRTNLEFAQEVCSRGNYFLNAPAGAAASAPSRKRRPSAMDDDAVGNRRGDGSQGSGSGSGGRAQSQARKAGRSQSKGR